MLLVAAAKFIKFGLVGVTGIIVDFSVTWFCKERLRWNKFLANSVGFTLAVINNYILNRVWTFESHNRQVALQFSLFLLVSLAGLLINNFLLWLLLKQTQKNFYLVKLIVTGIVFFWNYFANSYITFK
ncbi:MAG: GtrA family protein [Sphingobacteriales bacterium]|nr:MAG: GtrA family protein [Sphingobacteriales bacterium]